MTQKAYCRVESMPMVNLQKRHVLSANSVQPNYTFHKLEARIAVQKSCKPLGATFLDKMWPVSAMCH